MPQSLSARSRQNLIEAMKEEAFASAKCRVLGRQARKGGHVQLADLLENTAEQHYLKRFAELAELLDLFVPSRQKVNEVINEESVLIDKICKLFAREAAEDGNIEVARCLNELRHDETLQRMQLSKAFSHMQIKDPSASRSEPEQRSSRRP